MNRYNLDTWGVWEKLATQYSGDKVLIAGLYNDLVNHYSEPHRHYHNMAHVQALLYLYDQYKDQLEKPEVVLFSIFYHDVVYTPGKSDNESQSALLAKRTLEQLVAPENVIEEVFLYINTTRDHKLSPLADADLKLFIDFDLSILAADQEEYKTYVLNVRKEYGYLSTEHFALGRKTFIRKFLSRKHIFYTNSFRAKEQRARKNMQWELEMSPGIFSAG